MERQVSTTDTINTVTTVGVEVAEKLLLDVFGIPNGALGNVAYELKHSGDMELTDEEAISLALIQIAGGHFIHEYLTGHLPTAE